jgi:hypothetical protein
MGRGQLKRSRCRIAAVVNRRHASLGRSRTEVGRRGSIAENRKNHEL